MRAEKWLHKDLRNKLFHEFRQPRSVRFCLAWQILALFVNVLI